MSTSSYDGHSSLEPNVSYEGGRSLAGISEKKNKDWDQLWIIIKG